LFFNRPKYNDLDSIIAGCRKGKEAAQYKLYQEYKDVLYGMARRYTKTSTDGEDVLMESFVKIFKSIDK